MTTDSKETEDLKKKLLGYNNLADGKVGSETRGALARPSPPKNTRYSPHVRRVNCQGISSAQYMTLPAVNAIPSAREIDSQSED